MIGRCGRMQNCLHGLEQAVGGEWLLQAGGEPKPGIGVVIPEGSAAGSYDDGQRHASTARTHRQLQAAQSGHVVVCNQQPVFLALQRFPANQAVPSDVHVIAGPQQNLAVDLSNRLVVIHVEDGRP